MDFEWLFDHFYISKVKLLGRKNIPCHRHESYEMYYLSSGQRTFYIGGTNYHVNQGEIVLIDRLEIHKVMDLARTQRTGFLLSFEEDFLEPIFNEPQRKELLSVFKHKVIRFTEVERVRLEQQLNKLHREAYAREDQFGTYARLLLGELFIMLGRRCRLTEEADLIKHEPKNRKIEEVLAYIHAHYREKLSLEQLAQLFFISKYHLSRMFKEVTGFTFVDYVRSRRILEAQRLMELGGRSITEIAEQAGFDSPTHFSRVFKEYTGISPLQFRKQFLK
ncbi:AraC family transcriptional regulator [Paenibacillus koleovorans]|uniref:AraC family transcriptional regulator n=1 Tax=Paenibacillus koleovorans TaxID=121608 RepID=UPI001FE44724|nr:AraC family transcriptional regulator [Paenibacillus koleovorans]